MSLTVKEVKQADEEDGSFEESICQARAGFQEGVGCVVGSELFDADNPQESILPRRDLLSRQMAGIEGLVAQSNGESQAKSDDTKV